MSALSTQSKSIEIINVNKKFGAFSALKEVSLNINPGEFACFLGPSGCGKTTLLRILAGLETVSSGTIKFAERDVTRIPAVHRDIGIVFQSYALFPNLTVRQNIEYGLVSSKAAHPDRHRKVKELLALVRLEAIVDKYPHQISGGQQQRVALARALAINPSILLLDEPLSALDAHVRVHLRLQLKELHRRIGLTTIMVTHDQEEAMVLADKVVIMNAGAVEQVGRPDEIYYQPKTSFVAGFVGSMNVLEVVIEESNYVTLGPWRMKVQHLGNLRPGDRARIYFRPEDGRHHSDGSRIDNVLQGVLVEREFVGHVMRCHVKVEAVDSPLIVTCPVQPDSIANFIPGGVFSVHVPAERMTLLPTA